MDRPHPRDEGVFSLRSRLSLDFRFGDDSVPRGFWAAFCVSVLLLYLCIFVSFHFCHGARTNYPFKPNPRSVKGRCELPTTSRLRSKRRNGRPFAVPNGQPFNRGWPRDGTFNIVILQVKSGWLAQDCTDTMTNSLHSYFREFGPGSTTLGSTFHDKETKDSRWSQPWCPLLSRLSPPFIAFEKTQRPKQSQSFHRTTWFRLTLGLRALLPRSLPSCLS